MPSNLTTRLLDWYHKNARVLPWRGITDPYAIWVSEIMLQQTRVETAIPYFARWMERFPSIADLAKASEEEVLAAWEGLGYYHRALNLHRAAQKVMAENQGILPTRAHLLQDLPGIGPYAAAAIASIAFGQDEIALDGNIRRVLARLIDVDQPVDSPPGETRLRELARAHLPQGQAGDFNQALMDLGAMVCTPRRPDCPACPLADLCLANRHGLQEQRPVRKPKPTTPQVRATAAVIRQNGKVLIARRPPGGLLGGLWEFPGGKVEPGESLVDCLRREIMEELMVEIQVGLTIGTFKHAYTHFRVELHAYECRLLGGEPSPLKATQLRWTSPASLADYPMGKIDRQIANILSSSDTRT